MSKENRERERERESSEILQPKKELKPVLQTKSTKKGTTNN